MKRIVFAYLFFASSLHSYSQTDSSSVLPYETFMEIVQANHPLAKQADLQVTKGNSSLLQSKGAFDPKLFTEVSQKYFDDKEYYNLVDGGIKLPTKIGVEVKGGYTNNSGYYLNPENNMPDEGLWYAGVSVPIGQGLLIDKRRAQLKQAELYVSISEQERTIMYNELLYEAGKAYWDWFKAYSVQRIYEEAVTIANTRLQAVKNSAKLGDKPSVDTLEAGIQVQNRVLNFQQATLDYKNATALLSVYLWSDEAIPLELTEGVVPETASAVEPMAVDDFYLTRLDSIEFTHPELAKMNYKIAQLEVDKKLKKEMLKPQLNLNYNALVQPLGSETFSSYSINNYKWGLEFSMPVFIRKERGALKLAEAKIQEANYVNRDKQAKLRAKVSFALNEWQTTLDQYNLYKQTVEDYRNLLEAERRLFNIGESSLFMINSRESSYISAQIKLAELLTKNRKSELSTIYSLGMLFSEM
ncbi:MAG: TolC family protein [Cyclobacteriaceae bacterium]|nr:TolC family protein [Cyclobacteriaceae bacterium]